MFIKIQSVKIASVNKIVFLIIKLLLEVKKYTIHQFCKNEVNNKIEIIKINFI